ncbi:MAG: hypothetical protein IKK52_04220 [Alphaproteobacteria bacterium]|nr:hypothetical protein [Alphaproteobacteria bacterium]
MKKIKFPIISKDDDECERTFAIIKFAVFVIAVCLLILALLKLCHWICPVLAWGFYFWNILQYRKGCFSQVVNEYDDNKRGCPHDGLRRVYHSWKVFAIIVAMVVVWFITKP